MAGLFDDLLPQEAKSGGGLFDDLLAPEAPKPEQGGLIASAKNAFGAMVKGAGQLAGDLPLIDDDNALKRYGQGVMDANPTAVNSFSDMAEKPWTAVKEAVGNAGGSIAGMVGTRAVGQGITALSPLAGPAAPAVALAGQAIAWLGPAAIAALPSYGGIREKQILNDPENNEDWKSKTIAALGAATVGAIESKFGPQNWALAAMTKEGRAALAEKFAETTLAKGIGYGALKGAAIEGSEEIAQQPIEQLASYDDPTSPESLRETAFSGAMGAIGGGVFGGAAGGVLHGQAQPKTDRDPIIPPASILSADTADEAISNFIGENSKPSNFKAEQRGLIGSIITAKAGPGFDARSVAGDYMDQRELDDLVQTERRDQQVMRAQIDQQRQKQAELDQIPRIAAEQNATQDAVKRAATLDAPTAMGSAFDKLINRTIAPEPEVEQAPPQPTPEPRIVERTDSMKPMPRELAELQVDMDGGEVVRIQNRNGKFAYTVIPKAADDSRNTRLQPLPSGSTGRGNSEPGVGLETALGRDGEQERAVGTGLPGLISSGESVAPVSGFDDQAVGGKPGIPQGIPEATDQPTITYDQFKQQMQSLLSESVKYSPNQVGGGHFAQKMAELSDKYPEYSSRLDGESQAPASESLGTQEPRNPGTQNSQNSQNSQNRLDSAPSFDFTRNATGTLTVHGDPAAIRAAGINGVAQFKDGKPAGILVSVKSAPDVMAQLEAARVQNNTENPANIEAAPAQARAEAPAVAGRAPGQAADTAAGSGAVQALTPIRRGTELPANATIVDAQGNEYRVHSYRHDTLIAHPIVDGKAQVNRDTTVRFWTNPDPELTPPGDNDRQDPVYIKPSQPQGTPNGTQADQAQPQQAKQQEAPAAAGVAPTSIFGMSAAQIGAMQGGKMSGADQFPGIQRSDEEIAQRKELVEKQRSEQNAAVDSAAQADPRIQALKDAGVESSALLQAEREAKDGDDSLIRDLARINNVTLPEAPKSSPAAADPRLTPVSQRAPKPDLTPSQQEELGSVLVQDFEKQYQQDIKDGIKRKRGLIKEDLSADKRTPLKSFLVQHGVSDSPSDVVGERNAFRANQILPRMFRKNGLAMDELAIRAWEAGFISQDDLDDGGGVEKLRDMIRRELSGEKQYPVDMADDAAKDVVDRQRRMDIEDHADSLGLPYDNDIKTDVLASMVKRIERYKAQPRNKDGLLKPDRVLKNAQEAVARIEKKRAQYEAEQADFASLTIAEQDALLDALTDADGNPVIVRQSEIKAEAAWQEAQTIWSERYGQAYTPEDGAARQAETPSAGIAEEGVGDDQQAGAQEQRRGDQAQDAGTQSSEGLTAPTREEVIAQQDRAEQAEKDKAQADKDAEAKAKAERIAKEIAARQEASADNFQLGQSAEDALAGQGSIFDAPAEIDAPKADRFEIGKSLTKEQRKAVLSSLVDVYKAKDAPRESKGQGRDGNERSGYAHSPELFEKSDITGAMVRYYVTLPDGRKAHPSELFPDYTQTDINNEIERRSNAEKRNRQIAREFYLEDTFDTKREAAIFWNNKSDNSIKTANGKPTVYDALERTHITDGNKFAMIPNDVLENKDMMDAIKAEGWAVAATTAAEKPSDPIASAVQAMADAVKGLQTALTPKVEKDQQTDGANIAKEPTPAYTGNYETDLFGNPLPAQTGKAASSRSKGAGVRGNVQPTSALQDTPAPAGEFNVNTIIGTEVSRELGASLIRDAQQAAQATRYLYKSAVERFDGIVTDKDGKPLAVVGGFKGAVSQASVYPATIMGEAIRIPGAAHIWFSHNHPSGKSTLSAADVNLNGTLSDVFRGSGIDPMGLLAVSGEEFSFVSAYGEGAYDPAKTIPPSIVKKTVPVIERQLGNGTPGELITSPTDAKSIAKKLYDSQGSGIMLLTSQNAIAGWMPIDSTLTGPLRNTGGANAIYRAISQSNAASAIIVHGGELDARGNLPAGVSAAENIASALQKLDVRALDSINVVTGRSAAESGMSIAQGPMYSRSDSAPIDQFERLANQSTAKALNATLVKYGLGQDWSNAYAAVKLPDTLSGVRAALQAAFGRDVRAVAPTAERFNIFNGVYIPSEPGAVYVNAAARVGFVNIAGHELWHAIKRQRPDLIAWYRENSRQFYKDLPAYQDRLNTLVQPGEKAYTSELAEEELEADFMGDSLADADFLQSLADASPSKFKALMTHVRLWLDKVVSKLKGLGSSKEVTDVKALQGYLKDVLVAYAEGKNIPQAPGEIAFNRAKNEPVTNQNDVVGNQGGRSADDSIPGDLLRKLEGTQVVDPNGRPLLVYHGTNAEFTEFDSDREPLTWETDRGLHFFVDSKAVAKGYADGTAEAHGGKARVVSAYLNLKNPRVETTDRTIDDYWDSEGASLRHFYPDADGFIIHGDGGTLYVATQSSQIIQQNEPTAPDSGGAFSRASDQTETAAFKKWFGASKVVDEQGRPLVVYHGAVVEGVDGISVFRDGTHFGTPQQADIARSDSFRYQHSKRGKSVDLRESTYPVYLSIKNPLRLRDIEDGWSDAIAKAKRDGHDGIVYDNKYEGGGDSWIAFEPTQIKSAIGNYGDFDATNPDIRFSRSVITGQSLPQTWQAPDATKMDDFIYSVQDKHVDTKRVTQAVRAVIGNIADNINPYLQEELYHGRAAMATKEFLEKDIRPFLTDLQARGIDMSDFEEYLHNRHAERRNVQVAKVNPNMPDGGSGINTADARAYLAGLPANTKRAYEALARRIDKINRDTRALLVSSGLEKQSTIDAWQAAYGDEYVPLMREEMDNGMGIGQGFSVRGGSSKRAMGSSKPVANIIANIALQREKAITRSEKQRIGHALYGMVLSAPNDDFWLAIDPKLQQNPAQILATASQLVSIGMNPADADSIAREPTSRYINPITGLVEERINPALRSADNVLAVRIDGEDKYVFFNAKDERAMRMAKALKNLDADQLGSVMGTVAKMTRWFSAVNTQYNPIFGVTNITRDVQTALLNLESTALKGHKADVMKHILPALRGIYIDLRDHRAGKQPTSAYAQIFEEFQREGGATGYRDMYANAEERADAIKDELADINAGKLKQLGKGVMGWLSDYNESMENAVRVSAYKVGVEQGLTKQQAASLAKNLTVNFNRKGQVALQAGALYAFFNASVQGTARIAQTLFEGGKLSAVGKKIITGGLLLGSMQALLLAAAGFDDDEPPDFVRERNLVIPIGDKKYITIPMPLGFHVLPNIARIPTEWTLGGFRNTPKRIGQMVGLFADAFNPIGSAGLSLQTLTPTIIDPLAALSENKDFTGRPIAKKDFDPMHPTAGHTRAKDAATPWAKFISQAVNFATGGTDYKPGLASPTPDQIDYLIGQVTGGVGREVGKASQVIGGSVSGEDVPLYKIPLVGRFVGTTEGQSAEASRFYENLRSIGEHKVELDGLRHDGRGAEAAEYFRENREAMLVSMATKVHGEVSKLNKLKRELIHKDASPERIKIIDAQITQKMALLNQRVKQMRSTEAIN